MAISNPHYGIFKNGADTFNVLIIDDDQPSSVTHHYANRDLTALFHSMDFQYTAAVCEVNNSHSIVGYKIGGIEFTVKRDAIYWGDNKLSQGGITTISSMFLVLHYSDDKYQVFGGECYTNLFTLLRPPTDTVMGYGVFVAPPLPSNVGLGTNSCDTEYFNETQSEIIRKCLGNAGEDPYSPGSETEPGGGEGDFDNTSDPIPEASIPTLSAVDAKFISLYTPTLAELQSLASYMWSPLFDLDTLKKIFADPMKAILGLSILPIAVPSSGQQTVTIGNISTGVNMTKASSQYVQIDCGTLNVNEYWGAYLDYSPYTKLEIYLPYIGTKQISVDDVMNKACHVYYNIDILTGACCAMIKCDDSVLYSYAGQCAVSIPITGSDWTNVVSGALSTALSVVGVAAGAVTGSAPLTGASAIGLVSSASQNVMQMKPIIEKSGSLGGSAGMLGVQSPYLILTRPRQALPNKQNHFTGYPSFVNVKLGDLTGMTFVEQVHLENIPCTSSEQSEIETLLKGGVIF